ncbi:MAG: Mut7-C RNAse domain-containing protein [Desulfobacteraceae bacterium]
MDRNPKQMDRPSDWQKPAFVVESTLGKLAKWEAENRVVLSRTHRVIERLKQEQVLLIQSDVPIEQVRQVINYFNIRPGDLAPLTRCSRCNSRLRPADGAHLQNAVPDFVRQHHVRFMMCVHCGRFYWPGTHSSRMADLFERWFEGVPE